jgi:5-methylcytosine-specific restriction enzyme subunit McrC
MEPIVLDEYESAVVPLSVEEVAGLRALAGLRLSITAADTPGEWVIRATAHVGTVVFGAVRVLIRPKVSNANLFHLLEAGGDALSVRPETFEYDRTGDLVPSFATFFARVAETALGRGVHRAYEEREEPLLALRGRIAVTAQQRQLGLPLPVACRFDEYTADVPLNRVVKAATERLRRLRGVTSTTRSALASILGRLEEVSPLHGPELRTATVFNRLNMHYQSAERLARMVLQGSSLLDLVGDAEAGAFLVNMNVLFEEFVEARLRDYLLGRLRVEGQAKHWLDSGHRVVRIVPDLVFTRGGPPLYVGDTKYKLLVDEERGRNPDYYQLLAYTTALDVHEGVLIYCHDDGVAPQPIVVEHTGTRLFVRGVRLDGTPAELDGQLRDLADWLAERCTTRLEASLSA